MVSEDAKAIIEALDKGLKKFGEEVKLLPKESEKPEKHLADELIACPECRKALKSYFDDRYEKLEGLEEPEEPDEDEEETSEDYI